MPSIAITLCVVIFLVHHLLVLDFGLLGSDAARHGGHKANTSADVATGRYRSIHPPKRLVQLTFMHRHGARQPPLIDEVTNSITWDYAMLTKVGALMAENLGRFLHRRYSGTKVAFNNRSAPSHDVSFIPTVQQAFGNTDISVYSLATSDDARCTQTGQGVARNFVGDSQSVSSVPFFNATPVPFDFILSFNGNFPSQPISKHNYNYGHNNSIAKSIFTDKEFEVLGSYVPGGMKTCTKAGEMTCALLARDVAQCLESNSGWSPDNENFKLLYPKLQHLQALRSNAYFGYNPIESPVDDVIGPTGYAVTSDIVLMAEKAFIAYQNGNVSPPPRINHLSAHDDTITGLVVALGAVSQKDTSSTTAIELWVPAFAQINAVEVHPNGNMSFWWAYPNQTHDSGYEYPDIDKVWPLVITCKDAVSGVEYRAAECPIADVRNFIEHTKPKIHTQSSNTLNQPLIAKEVPGMGVACYLTSEQRRQCERTWFSQDTISKGIPSNIIGRHATVFESTVIDGAKSSAATEAQCRKYLSDCPIEACGPDYAPAPRTTLSGVFTASTGIDAASPNMGNYYEYYWCVALAPLESPSHIGESTTSYMRRKMVSVGVPIALAVFGISMILGAMVRVHKTKNNNNIDSYDVLDTDDREGVIYD